MNDYADEILSQCETILNCPKKRFYPNKDFGCEIAGQYNRFSQDEILSYARQALSDLNCVLVKSVEVNKNFISLILEIFGEERKVKIDIEKDI